MKITKTTFDGLDGFEINTGKVRMVVITSCGPRIAFYGKPKGKNLLFWDTHDYSRGEWKLRGGHRVWLTRPGADESEETYCADNGPCSVQRKGKSVTVTGALDPISKYRRGFTIREISATVFEVDNFMTNRSDMLWSGGVWGLTCTLPTNHKTYAVPIGDGSDWDCFSILYPKTWGGHMTRLDGPQWTLTNEFLILKPAGIETKRAIQAPRGIIGVRVPGEKYSFFKKVEYDTAAQYPCNTNIAMYCGPDNFMVEMETMGPERTVKPGETLHNIETWSMTRLVRWDFAKKIERLLK